jgi:hypothetical protein
VKGIEGANSGAMSAPSDDDTWPELTWEPAAQRVAWLVERTRELATLARAFEQALEDAQAEGQAPLSRVARELELWERTCANLWMYVGLGEAKKVPADEVPLHAEELAKTWARLREMRSDILEKLGEAAAGVRERERAAKVDEAALTARAGELPTFSAEVDALGAPVAQIPVVGDAPARPVTGDEFRHRQMQESRTLPEPATLAALLEASPPAWVECAFETLGLELAEPAEQNAHSRTAQLRRSLTAQMTPEFLRQVVFALEEQDRSLLSSLVSAKGTLRYGQVTSVYGRDDADGYSWQERPPSGPLARLRRVGLAYVGMSGKRLVVQLPEDLIEPLRELLEAPEAQP